MTYEGIWTSGTMTQIQQVALLDMMKAENTKDIKDAMGSIDRVINRVKNSHRWMGEHPTWSQRTMTRTKESAIRRLKASLEEARTYLQEQTSAFSDWEVAP